MLQRLQVGRVASQLLLLGHRVVHQTYDILVEMVAELLKVILMIANRKTLLVAGQMIERSMIFLVLKKKSKGHYKL